MPIADAMAFVEPSLDLRSFVGVFLRHQRLPKPEERPRVVRIDLQIGPKDASA